jgi:hypothetical protein
MRPLKAKKLSQTSGDRTHDMVDSWNLQVVGHFLATKTQNLNAMRPRFTTDPVPFTEYYRQLVYVAFDATETYRRTSRYQTPWRGGVVGS